MRVRFLAALVLLCSVGRPAGAAETEEALWAALKQGGHVAIMRHATAPGFGDPEGFRLNDCSTQRNLSDAGRAQARRIGDAIRAHGVTIGRVLSSRWCRCLETAALLGLGPVEAYPPLDSLHGRQERSKEQTAELRRLIAAHVSGPSLLLVTHPAHIAALPETYPRPGEIVVLRASTDTRRVGKACVRNGRSRW